MANFMRLSLLKAAHVAAGEYRVAGNPGALRSRDDNSAIQGNGLKRDQTLTTVRMQLSEGVGTYLADAGR